MRRYPMPLIRELAIGGSQLDWLEDVDANAVIAMRQAPSAPHLPFLFIRPL